MEAKEAVVAALGTDVRKQEIDEDLEKAERELQRELWNFVKDLSVLFFSF